MSNKDILIGMQSHSRSDLAKKIKKYKSLRIVTDKRPVWYEGNWTQTYTIVPKNKK